MASADTSLSTSSSRRQDKDSKNKRKHRNDQSDNEAGPSGMDFEAAAVMDSPVEHHTDDCCMCKAMDSTPEEAMESHSYLRWSDRGEEQLEEILLRSLDLIFDNAVGAITEMGYAEASARAAVVRASSRYRWRETQDCLAGLGEAAVKVMETEEDLLPAEGASEDDLRRIKKDVLDSMITLVTKARPFLTEGDAMFYLLVSDMNIAFATSGDNGVMGAEMLTTQPGITYRGTIALMSSSENPAKLDPSSVSGNTLRVMPDLKLKEHPAALPDHSGVPPFAAMATQSAKDGKLARGKKGMRESSTRDWRDCSHRQKSSTGSKGSLRSGKHDPRVGKVFMTSVTPLPSNPSSDAKTDGVSDGATPYVNHNSEAEVPNSGDHKKPWTLRDRKDEITLMLVVRKKDLQRRTREWRDWAMHRVAQVTHRLAREKAELLSLRKEKEELGSLQEERNSLEESARKQILEFETAIAKARERNERENEDASRFEADKEMLRAEMDYAKRKAAELADKFQELSTKDENTQKKSQECESERSRLQQELAAEKRNLSQVQQQLQHAKEKKDQLQARWRQEEALKNEAIARETSEKKAREQMETSARARENFLHLKAENDKQRYKRDTRTCQQQISKVRATLDSMMADNFRRMADNNINAHSLEEERKKSNAQVLAKLSASRDLDGDDIDRDKECAMCLTKEASVVFLPCAHQPVCARCNDLHEKQGMEECPSCRTPIQRRVCACYADL